jgi:hypothetical protein
LGVLLLRVVLLVCEAEQTFGRPVGEGIKLLLKLDQFGLREIFLAGEGAYLLLCDLPLVFEGAYLVLEQLYLVLIFADYLVELVLPLRGDLFGFALIVRFHLQTVQLP